MSSPSGLPAPPLTCAISMPLALFRVVFNICVSSSSSIAASLLFAAVNAARVFVFDRATLGEGARPRKLGFVVSHPSLEKSEGWGTLSFVLSRRVGHPPAAANRGGAVRVMPKNPVWWNRKSAKSLGDLDRKAHIALLFVLWN